MNNKISKIILTFFLASFLGNFTSHASSSSDKLIPEAKKSEKCSVWRPYSKAKNKVYWDVEISAPSKNNEVKVESSESLEKIINAHINEKTTEDLKIHRGNLVYVPNHNASIGTKIKCGTVGLTDFMSFIIRLLDFIVSFAGVAVGIIMIIVAGYQYIYGGVFEDKEKGKETIKFVLQGAFLILISWKLVDWIQWLVTAGS
jgi:hypothetical protein